MLLINYVLIFNLNNNTIFNVIVNVKIIKIITAKNLINNIFTISKYKKVNKIENSENSYYYITIILNIFKTAIIASIFAKIITIFNVYLVLTNVIFINVILVLFNLTVIPLINAKFNFNDVFKYVI